MPANRKFSGLSGGMAAHGLVLTVLVAAPLYGQGGAITSEPELVRQVEAVLGDAAAALAAERWDDAACCLTPASLEALEALREPAPPASSTGPDDSLTYLDSIFADALGAASAAGAGAMSSAWRVTDVYRLDSETIYAIVVEDPPGGDGAGGTGVPYETGVLLRRGGREEWRIDLLDTLGQLPGEPIAMIWGERGAFYYERGEFALAIVAYARAAEASPMTASYVHDLGLALWYQGHASDASRELGRAVAMDPRNAYYPFSYGLYWLEHEDAVTAAAYLERSIELDPSNASVHHELGRAYHTTGRFEDAMAAYARTIEINSTFAGAYYNRALIRKVRGETDTAVADLTEYLRLQPDSPEALYERALLHLDQRRTEDAVSDLRRVVQLGTNAELAADARRRLVELGYDPVR